MFFLPRTLNLIFLLLFLSSSLNAQITTYPYVETFESGSGGWSSYGTNNSWELGDPSGFIINYAASGTNAWVTNINGAYTNNEDGYVQSPVFDFSTITNPAIILKIWWDSERGFDGTVLQSSTNSGATWQNVGSFGDSNGWFNHNYIYGNPGGQLEGWSGTGSNNGSNGWLTSAHYLSSLIGENNVIFRVAFGSDGSIVEEGFAFDDVEILSLETYANAGEDVNFSYCLDNSEQTLNLNNLLSEDAMSNGSWESLSDLHVSNDGFVTLTTDQEWGVFRFKYTVIDENNIEDNAIIQLNLQVPADAGSDSTITLCNARIVYLQPFLDSGVSNEGVWESLNSPPVPFEYSDTADLSSFGVGSYDFTYTVTSESCGEPDTSTLTIVIESLSAGSNGILNICDTFTEDDLFNALDGNPGPGGVWSPTINGPGDYTYTQAATTNCPETSAIVEVNQIVQLTAGIDRNIQSCSESSLEEFLVELGGDEGGIWSPSYYQGSGNYTYTHPATECTVESSATIDFSIPNPPDAGEDATVEGSFGTSNLDDLRGLSRSSDYSRRVDDGIWVQISNGSPNVLMSSDGEVDFPNTGAGAAQLYEFEYQVSGACQDDFATVIVTIFGEDTAGVDGTLTICPGGNFYYSYLFNALGGNPSIRGYWVEPLDGPGIYTYIAQDNNFSEADSAQIEVIEETQKLAGVDASINICEGETLTNAELFAALGDTADTGGTWEETATGIYEYSHAATTCYASVSATVTIIEEEQKSAGSSATLNICEGETLTNDELFSALGDTADTGGTWNETATGVYEYSHAATTCYASVSATVTLIVDTQKSAGIDASINICEGETLTNAELFTALGDTADTGGTWNETNTGVYEYSHAATSCYPIVSATVTLIEETQKSAGIDASINICAGEALTNVELFTALGDTADTGGTWEETTTGVYEYSHAATTCYPIVSATVTLIEEGQKSAGMDASIDICEGETLTSAELFTALGDTADTGGTWNETTTGVYEYSHAATTCYPLVSATITLIEEPQKSAGENGTLEIENGTIVTETQLFEALEGNPDLGGTWSPELAGEGTYTYTHAAGICMESSADVVVIEGSLSLDDEDLKTISVFPNPVKAVLQIRNSYTIAIKSIEIVTITGQLVMRIEDDFTEINVSKLESAMYFLQIKTEIGQKTVKFIKE